MSATSVLTNPDGALLAWVYPNGKVRYLSGIELEEMISALRRERKHRRLARTVEETRRKLDEGGYGP